MKTIAMLATKGGVGKSTLALHLAVEAGRTGRKSVVIIDLDPQQSAWNWYDRRDAEEPLLIHPSGRPLADVLALCADADIGLAVIDTAPHDKASAEAAAAVADLVVIPTRAGQLDIEAIRTTVAIVRAAEAPGAIVLNAVRPRGRLTSEARQALKAYGLPICPTAIVQRAALADALIDGRTAGELDPRGKAAAEISATWKWLKRKM